MPKSVIEDPYCYFTTWSNEAQAYIGMCADFPRLHWLDPSPQKATMGIQALVREATKRRQVEGHQET